MTLKGIKRNFLMKLQALKWAASIRPRFGRLVQEEARQIRKLSHSLTFTMRLPIKSEPRGINMLEGRRNVKPLRPKQWSESELRRLRLFARNRVSADVAAEGLGRHVGSVKTKAREMGLILPKSAKAARKKT